MKYVRSLFLALILCVSLLTVAHAAELTDVPENASYAEAVQWAADQDLITGFEDGTFRPHYVCTRGQAVAILWRAAGEPIPTLEANPFLDVSPTMYNYYAILWAAEKGITVGRTADTFAPDDPCTISQILTFLWRAEGMPAASTASDLAAANDGAYYTDALAWADTTGILDIPSNAFISSAPASRADIATYLYLKSMPRMMEDAPLAGAGQLVISQQPQSMTTQGGMVSFTVQASGGQAPYTYAWESRTGSGTWYRVYDTSSNTLTKFPAASMITSGLYFRCVVSDAAGNKVTSDTAKVLEPGESYTGSSSGSSQSGSSSGGSSAPSSGPLAIKTQPQSIVAKAGNSVTFKVEVSGGQSPYTYKWESRNNATDWARVYDSTSNTLTKYPTLDMMKSGLRFRCTITDAAGSTVTSSEAAVSSTDQDIDSVIDSLADTGVFAICETPRSVSCLPGESVELSIDFVGGALPHSYLWEYRTDSSGWSKFEGGQRKSIVSFKPPQYALDQGIQVRCTVRDAAGKELRSDTARVLKLDTPSDGTLKIAAQPQSVTGSTYSAKDPVTFSVEVTGGTAPYQYHWQCASSKGTSEYKGFQDITEIPGGWATGYTSSQLTVPFSKDLLSEDYQFCCRITDAKGNTVVTKPAVFTDSYTGPRFKGVIYGCAYKPSLRGDIVTASTVSDLPAIVEGGVGPYTYQWQYRLTENSEIINFSSAESAWASGFHTDTLHVLAQPPFESSDPHYYRSPQYRCIVTGGDGQFTYSNWCVTAIYE